MSRKFRFVTGPFLVLTIVGLSFLPVNRNTAVQIWHTVHPASAPRVGMFISGSGITHPIFGDTWFSRYKQFKDWLYPSPRMTLAPHVIIAEDDAN